MIKGRYALITGATKGIGRSVAYALAEAGCHLALSARTEVDLQELQTDLRSEFSQLRIEYIVADCKDQEQVRYLAHQCNRLFPELDILINNVGMFCSGTFLEEEEQVLADQLAVNVLCTHYLAVFFGRKMCSKGKGHIVNLGSIAGKVPFPKAASYSVTKFAVHGLTAILRQEFGAYGVKVTEVIPGSTYTASWEGPTVPEEKFVASADIAEAGLMSLRLSGGANVDELVIRPLDEQV